MLYITDNDLIVIVDLLRFSNSITDNFAYK